MSRFNCIAKSLKDFTRFDISKLNIAHLALLTGQSTFQGRTNFYAVFDQCGNDIGQLDDWFNTSVL